MDDGLVVFLSEGDKLTVRMTIEENFPNGKIWYGMDATTVLKPDEIEGIQVDENGDPVEYYGDGRVRVTEAVLGGIEYVRAEYLTRKKAERAAASRRRDET